jgi:hypothetical protein
MNRFIACLSICATGVVAQNANVSLSGTAALSGTSAFTINGTATVSGLGNATLTGGGPFDLSLITGDVSLPIGGNFAMAFSDGAILYGTFVIPKGILIPSVGQATTATGIVNILGGLGRLDGARGTITNMTGTGTATGTTTSTFMVQGSGTLVTGQKVLPQFVSGGGWYTALYFNNPTSAAVSFPVSVTSDNGSPLSVAGFGGTSTTVNIPAGGSVRLEAPNTGDLSQGYVITTPPTGVTGYGVFRQSVPGVPDQEAVVPLSSIGSGTGTFTFDDTNFITAAAIVNTGASSATVTVTAKSNAGTSLGSGSITIAAKNKTAVALRNIQGLSGVVGNTGTVTFSISSGSIAVLGLRFNGTAFTSIPASDR